MATLTDAPTGTDWSPPRLGHDLSVVVFGVGNTLGMDDGVGVHVVRRLAHTSADLPDVDFVDAGTVSFPLLADIETHDALIVVDAARMQTEPGSVHVYEGVDMDAFIAANRPRSVHDVSLAEMLQAAALTSCLPRHRALVGIEPEAIGLGTEPTKVVQAAVDTASRAVRDLIGRWRHEF